MPKFDLQLVSIDLDASLETCLSFRQDAHLISFGNTKDLRASELLHWFKKLSKLPDSGFYHLEVNNQIVGQVEYQSQRTDSQGTRYGYIFLLYLVEQSRGKGLGTRALNLVLERLQQDGCCYAQLRYIPANRVAGEFYAKQGWKAVGADNDKGQLLEIALEQHCADKVDND